MTAQTKKYHAAHEKLRKQGTYVRMDCARHKRAMDFLCLLLYISNWNWMCAAAFVQQWILKYRRIHLSADAAREETDRLFMSMLPSQQECLLQDLHSSHHNDKVSKAKRFILHWKLAHYVNTSNANGFAPDHRLLDREIQRIIEKEPENDGIRRSAYLLSEPHYRTRWKKKYQLGYTTLPTRPRFTKHNLQEKVHSQEK